MSKKWIAFLTAGVIAFSCMTAQAEEPARRSITVTGTSEVRRNFLSQREGSGS